MVVNGLVLLLLLSVVEPGGRVHTLGSSLHYALRETWLPTYCHVLRRAMLACPYPISLYLNFSSQKLSKLLSFIISTCT